MVPYEIPIPNPLGPLWKAKVLDREVPREEPHVTIICKTRRWRYAIRTQDFLDSDPPSREVPAEVLAAIDADRANVIAAWNTRHPHNPIGNSNDH